MEIRIVIDGEGLNAKLVAKQLRQLAGMVMAGVTDVDGSTLDGGTFSMIVDFGDHEHLDYWDGEGNHVHVDEEGFVVVVQHPDTPEGVPDVENIRSQGIKLADWAKDHGGITPFGTPEEDLKDDQ